MNFGITCFWGDLTNFLFHCFRLWAIKNRYNFWIRRLEMLVTHFFLSLTYSWTFFYRMYCWDHIHSPDASLEIFRYFQCRTSPKHYWATSCIADWPIPYWCYLSSFWPQPHFQIEVPCVPKSHDYYKVPWTLQKEPHSLKETYLLRLFHPTVQVEYRWLWRNLGKFFNFFLVSHCKVLKVHGMPFS